MKIKKSIVLALLSLSTTLISQQSFSSDKPEKVFQQRGIASYYAHQFHGRKTASGKTYNMHELTCAHRTLPFGTKLKVTDLSTGKDVILKVTDRGPFHGNRILDMSLGAAKALGVVDNGLAKVKIEILK